MDTENVRRYIFKLHPSYQQAKILHEQRVMMGQLWNALLQRCEDTARRTLQKDGKRKLLSFFDMTKEITNLRHECPEWTLIPAITKYRVAKHLDEAFAAFFRRIKVGDEAGYPRYKRTALSTTIPLGTMDKTGWYFEQRKDNPRSWLLYYKSVSDRKDKATWIHARGCLPTDVAKLTESWRNADIIWRDNAWWLSTCVIMNTRREAGKIPTTVRFGQLGSLAVVNNIDVTPDSFAELQVEKDHLDHLKSLRDQQWPRSKRRSDVEQAEFNRAQSEISRLETNIRRRRHDTLHIWTAGLVTRASRLLIELPRLQLHIQTPRGNEKAWGAEVKTVSALNRTVLFYAPYTAVMMLKYKAAEAGIECEVKVLDHPEIEIGQDLVTSGKQTRRVARMVKQSAYVSQ